MCMPGEVSFCTALGRSGASLRLLGPQQLLALLLPLHVQRTSPIPTLEFISGSCGPSGGMSPSTRPYWA